MQEPPSKAAEPKQSKFVDFNTSQADNLKRIASEALVLMSKRERSGSASSETGIFGDRLVVESPGREEA